MKNIRLRINKENDLYIRTIKSKSYGMSKSAFYRDVIENILSKEDVPCLRKKKEEMHVSLTLPDEDYSRLVDIAKKSKVTLSKLLELGVMGKI